MRFTVCVHFRADLTDIAHAIALEADKTTEPEFPKSRQHAMRILRSEYHAAGSQLWAHAENVPSQTNEEARKCAKKLFPELSLSQPT